MNTTQWAESLGYKVGKFLGSGYNASVYELPGTRFVLKETVDQSEYHAMLKAQIAQQEDKAQYLVKAKHIVRLVNATEWGSTRYAFILERLDPLTDEQHEAAIRVGYGTIRADGTHTLRGFGDDFRICNVSDHIASIREAGIALVKDWKRGNVMRRGNIVVLSDLGCSS